MSIITKFSITKLLPRVYERTNLSYKYLNGYDDAGCQISQSLKHFLHLMKLLPWKTDFLTYVLSPDDQETTSRKSAAKLGKEHLTMASFPSITNSSKTLVSYGWFTADDIHVRNEKEKYI